MSTLLKPTNTSTQVTEGGSTLELSHEGSNCQVHELSFQMQMLQEVK